MKSEDTKRRGASTGAAPSPFETTAKRDKLVRAFKHSAKITLAATGDFNRDRTPYIARVARAIAGKMVRDAMREIDRPAPAVVTALYGRADAAYKVEFAKWEALIADVRADRGLNDDQRAASILALRIRQKIEAEAVRRKIIREEKQAAKVRRAHARTLHR